MANLQSCHQVCYLPTAALPYRILVLIFQLFHIFACKSSNSNKRFTTVMHFPKPVLSSVELQSVCQYIELVCIWFGTVFYISVRYKTKVLHKTIQFFISLHMNVLSLYFQLLLSFILIFQCKIWPKGDVCQLPSWTETASSLGSDQYTAACSGVSTFYCCRDWLVVECVDNCEWWTKAVITVCSKI